MRILALEFSTAIRSVAVLDSGPPRPGLAPPGHSVVRAGPGQPAHATTLADRALAAAGWATETVDRLAIGLGPGSYTGIRMAIAFAQGWQLARPVNVIGISSALCLAHQMKDRGHLGPVHVAIDAQRNEYCLGQFLIAANEVRELHPLTLVSAAILKDMLDTGKILAGPGLSGRFPKALEIVPDALCLGRLAFQVPACVPAEQLAPIYLRPVQFVRAPAPRKI